MTEKFELIPYIDKRTNKSCMLINNPHELTKSFKYEDGSQKIVSIATFKRWYKKVEDEPFVFVETKKEDAPIQVEVDFTKAPTDPTNINAVKTAVKTLAKKIKEDKQDENTEGNQNDDEKGKQSKTRKKSGKRESKKNANVAVKVPEIAPIELVVKICETRSYPYKKSKDGVAILNSDGKRLLDIWKRKYEVRIYVANGNEKINTLDRGLVSKFETLSGNIAKRYPYSIYVPYDNINTVIEYLMS